MKVHGKAEPSGFTGDIAEKIILKLCVLSTRGNSALDKVRVDGVGLCHVSRRVGRNGAEVERAQIRSFKLDGHRAFFLLQFQGGSDDPLSVFSQRVWHGIDT